MTFTKSELALVLMSKLAFSRQDARKFVCSFFDKISEALYAGESVKISGMGNFILRDKKSRPGRNPKTKENIPVEARRVVTFQASQTLKKRMLEVWTAVGKDVLARSSVQNLSSGRSILRHELDTALTADAKDLMPAEKCPL